MSLNPAMVAAEHGCVKNTLNSILETAKELDDDLFQGHLGLVKGNEFQRVHNTFHPSKRNAMI